MFKISLNKFTASTGPFLKLQTPELTANKSRSLNSQEYWRADNLGSFQSFSPIETGGFSVSIISWSTAFLKDDEQYSSRTFAQFRNYRNEIAKRLAAENPDFNGGINPLTGYPIEYVINGTDTTYTGGYGPTSQDVIIPAFLAAYTGKDALRVSLRKFPKIPFKESMNKYGTDKPDLRNPLIISDITKLFVRDDISFEIFKKLVKKGSIVRSIIIKNIKDKPRSFFDGIDKWAKDQGSSGLAYFTLEKNQKISGKGPVGKFFSEESLIELMKLTNAEVGDTIFLSCGKQSDVEKILSLARTKIAEELNLIKDDHFAFCWIVDYPIFELDELTKKIKFSHNPFSMPQGDIHNLDLSKPLSLKAYQYDIVCNGIELSSGAIRNHIPELMYKLFDIAGYSKKDVENKFSGMINALSYGAPPHGGIAPGIDRIVMLLANEKNIREVTMFPMNQNAQDLMMNAPSEIEESQLKELSLSLKTKK